MGAGGAYSESIRGTLFRAYWRAKPLHSPKGKGADGGTWVKGGSVR